MNKTPNLSTSELVEQPKDIAKQIFNHELTQATFILVVTLLFTITLAILNYFTEGEFTVSGFGWFLVFMLVLIHASDTIYARIGNLIGGHRFFKAWLISPCVYIITLITIFLMMKHQFPDSITPENSGFLIGSLMASMVFLHSTVAIQRYEPQDFEQILIADQGFRKKIFLNKKQAWILRICYASISFISTSILINGAT